jgi:hypothetical protein
VKYFKNSQQIDYAKDHGNSYADGERNSLRYFKIKSVHIIALICRLETVIANMAFSKADLLAHVRKLADATVE